jgi:16S rRNA (cytidine1402-2'-O)-methyltransferase
MKKGTLYLLPTTLGDNGTIPKVLPEYNTELIRTLDIFIVENLRTARRFIAKLNHPVPIDNMTFYELGKHTPEEDIRSFLNPILQGNSIGLLSEAGTPCVADPGAVVVDYAHQLKVRVIPLVGPNSIILALMASGFNGQSFTFHGYLPVEKMDLVKKLRQMEVAIQKENQTQIFIETPFRNRKLFEALLSNCAKQSKLCVATDISLSTEKIKTLTIAGWQKETVDFHKKPTVFLLFR